MDGDSGHVRIDLATETDFRLGRLLVRPSLRQVESRDERLTLEPRVMQVLACLVRRAGEVVSRDQLIRACWGDVVVGDDSITRCIARIRKLDEAGEAFSLDTISRVGYRLIPVEAEAEAPATADLAPPPHSIAVLPFADMSPEHDQEYFADGLAEALLNLLAANSGLRVAARTSSFAFKGMGRTIAEIARELGVAMVVEGSVRKAGDKVRIAAQLVDARSGFHIWSESFTRELVDVFQVQDEISAAIAGRLEAQMGTSPPAVGSRTRNPRAYEAFLEGNFHFGKGETASWKLAQAAYQRAIDLDPAFAPAYARQARAILKELHISREAYARARTLIDTALNLQPDLPEALYALGLQTFLLGDVAAHNAAMERLAAVAPDSRLAVMGRIRLLALSQHYRQARPFIERLGEIDPLGAEANVTSGLVLSLQDGLDEGIARIRRAIPFNPQSIELRTVLATLDMLKGDIAGAASAFIDVLEQTPGDSRSRIWLGVLLARSGFDEEADRLGSDIIMRSLYGGPRAPCVDEIPSSMMEGLRPVTRASLLWRAGEVSAAKPFLEEAYAAGAQAPAFAFTNPGLFKAMLLSARRRAGETGPYDALKSEMEEDVVRGMANGWAGASLLSFRMQLAAASGDAHSFAELAREARREDLDFGIRTFADVMFEEIRPTPDFEKTRAAYEESWRRRGEELVSAGAPGRIRELLDRWK